ncbi:ABC transporter, iron(III) dicitrate-binding protein [Rivularia sp. IAM M-261]|nr:ABC transporter, iron(III) dicitrate-binding protein [Rivularia sp. IAM M-261]
MRKQLYHQIKPFLLMAFSFILVTACYQPVIQKPYISLKPSVECRVIQHKFGETCVPLKPKRIIALDPRITLDPLIALGIKPIGFASYNGKGKEVLFGVSFDKVQGTKNVGDTNQPSLEKILMLKPDLILSTDYSNAHQKYKLLSAIAPTVSVPNESNMAALDLENKAYFEKNLRYIAKLLGQQAKAEKVLSQYQKRIEELKKRLGNQLQQIEVSVIFYGEGYIWTIAKSDTISHVLTDIGLRHKFVPYGEWNLSIETIHEYDADVLFIVDIDGRTPSFYFQNPMFSSLNVVKNNRAYVVSQENWRSFGMSGANKILDDLFKYLPKSIQ